MVAQSIAIPSQPTSRPRAQRRLSDSQIALAKALLAEGLSVLATARKLGISESTLRSRIDREQWSIGKSPSPDELELAQFIGAERITWSRESVATWRQLAGMAKRSIATLAVNHADSAPVRDTTDWTNCWSRIDSGLRTALGMDAQSAGPGTIGISKSVVQVVNKR